MPLSEADNTKMQAARVLIEEKRYTEAKVLLKGIDDTKARNWLHKLERLSPKRQKRRLSIVIFASLGLLLVIAAISAGLFLKRENDNIYATQIAQQAAQQTVTAASSTLEYHRQLQRIDLIARLTTYCVTTAERSQGDCRRWSDVVLASKFTEAKLCNDEYDFIYDGQNFGLCLVVNGIAVFGDQALIKPIDPATLTFADQMKIASSVTDCKETKGDDYCYPWALITYFSSK